MLVRAKIPGEPCPTQNGKKKSGLFLIGAEHYEYRNNRDLIPNVTQYHV